MGENMNDVYMREDYTIPGMYRVMIYSQFQGYWSTSELMDEETAKKEIRFYRGLRK